MAMDLGSKGSLKADINVTPLVDVMLVLLIIMMLIAPMLQNVAVALPQADHSGEKPDTQEQTVVTVDALGKFSVNLLPVAPEELIPRVQRALGERKEKIVYVRGDKNARYAAIMDAMDALRRAQIENIALITERKPEVAKTAGGGR